MTRYSKILIPFVLLSLALWSCDRDKIDGRDNDSEHIISFITIVENPGFTRGVTVTSDDGTNPMLEMGVYSTYDSVNMYKAIYERKKGIYYFKNLKVTRELSGSTLTDWTYSPVYLWPNMAGTNKKLRFVAYSPYANSSVNGLTVKSTDTTLYVTYKTPSNIANQPDLIVSDTVASNNPNSPVTLQFNHVLSMHRFAIGENMVPGLTITKISFYGIFRTGEYNLTNNQWGYNLSSSGDRSYGDGTAPLYTTTGTSQERALTNILKDNLCFFLIPQASSYAEDNEYGTPKKSSSYIYITYDFNGVTTEKRFKTQEWEKGKVYTYRLKFESGGLSFDVESGITGWESGEPTDHPVYNW